jgi:hypothetical protein
MDIDFNQLYNDHKKLSKIMFIFNALEDGWTIKKRGPKYIFSKHKSKEKEIFFDNYLDKFLQKYFNNLEK